MGVPRNPVVSQTVKDVVKDKEESEVLFSEVYFKEELNPTTPSLLQETFGNTGTKIAEKLEEINDTFMSEVFFKEELNPKTESLLRSEFGNNIPTKSKPTPNSVTSSSKPSATKQSTDTTSQKVFSVLFLVIKE